MNENAQKWVQALRSGEYKQTYGRLRRRDSFCCLGVACDLYAKETGRGEWASGSVRVRTEEEWASGSVFVGTEEEEDGVLPDEVRDWLGLRTDAGDYGLDGVLVADNDAGASFEQIADTVEAEPKGLFK